MSVGVGIVKHPACIGARDCVRFPSMPQVKDCGWVGYYCLPLLLSKSVCVSSIVSFVCHVHSFLYYYHCEGCFCQWVPPTVCMYVCHNNRLLPTKSHSVVVTTKRDPAHYNHLFRWQLWPFGDLYSNVPYLFLHNAIICFNCFTNGT